MVFGQELGDHVSLTLWKFLAAGFVIITGAQCKRAEAVRCTQLAMSKWGVLGHCHHEQPCKQEHGNHLQIAVLPASATCW